MSDLNIDGKIVKQNNMKKLLSVTLSIVYYLTAPVAVVILYTFFRSSVSTGIRWIFWIVFLGSLWFAAWFVARKQGKSLSDIWNNDEESTSDQN